MSEQMNILENRWKQTLSDFCIIQPKAWGKLDTIIGKNSFGMRSSTSAEYHGGNSNACVAFTMRWGGEPLNQSVFVHPRHIGTDTRRQESFTALGEKSEPQTLNLPPNELPKVPVSNIIQLRGNYRERRVYNLNSINLYSILQCLDKQALEGRTKISRTKSNVLFFFIRKHNGQKMQHIRSWKWDASNHKSRRERWHEARHSMSLQTVPE